MTRDPEKFPYDILDSSRFLIEFTARETADRYRTDRPFRSAIERELQIIGEAMLQLNSHSPEVAEANAESDRIIAFRHVLVHGYFSLNEVTVWEIIQTKLPVLADRVAGLLPGTSE